VTLKTGVMMLTIFNIYEHRIKTLERNQLVLFSKDALNGSKVTV